MEIPSAFPIDGPADVSDEAGTAVLRSILATVPDAMVVIDEGGRIVSFSNAAERMFGFAEHEVSGRNVSLLIRSPAGDRRALDVRPISTAIRRDGTVFPIELTLGEAMTPRGRIFTGFIRDLTERRRTERRLHDLHVELADASRISAVGTLAAALAHELNQPLTAITNYVEGARDLIIARSEASHPLRDALEEAAAQSLRAGRIVRQLRDFIARDDPGRLVHSLALLISEANAIAFAGSATAEVDVRIDLDPAANSVLVDRPRIQHTVLNLIRNAIDAIRNAATKRIDISARSVSDEQVEIVIEDSGACLSVETEATLFEPFRSTRTDGLGLGLSTCRNIIEGQGGRIWTSVSPLGGNAFHFTLQRAGNATTA